VISELVLLDIRPVQHPQSAACAVTQVQGDLRERRVLDELFSRPVDVVFHLAATLTLDAERDFLRGLETNVLALIDLLERCRQQSPRPMLLFASSISTFGGELPDVVGDDVFQAPTTSYGTHKVVAEHLLADYSRHGFIDGRALRLPIVVTHPGPPSGSISDQVSAMIREPLRGQTVTCQIAPDSRMVVASVDKVLDGFLRLASLSAQAVRAARIMNLPGLTVTPIDLANAVSRHLGVSAGAFVQWRPEPHVQRIIDGWPRAFTSQRALALGIEGDVTADALVDAFVANENSGA
jgi:nucleoside-diphosphate-sugar epimerase